MFTDYARPFYAQAIPLELQPIAKEKFFHFVKQKFEKSRKDISRPAFVILYDMVEGESWLIQNVCYHLWQEHKIIQKEHIASMIEEIAAMSDAIYKVMFDNFSNTQKAALKIIIHNHGVNLLSKEILNVNNISKSSLVSALNVLLDKEIIDKSENNVYLINDKLFEIWLQK